MAAWSVSEYLLSPASSFFTALTSSELAAGSWFPEVLHSYLELAPALRTVLCQPLLVWLYRWMHVINNLLPSPHLSVLATSKRFLPARGTFRAILASESHWLGIFCKILSVLENIVMNLNNSMEMLARELPPLKKTPTIFECSPISLHGNV
jgi:hypothetical protein